MVANAFASQYAQAADAMLGATGREAFDAVKMLKDANPAGYAPANGAEYPRSGFGDAMRQIAQIVKADLGLEVAFTELGQWDHHTNEGGSTGQIANRLDDFASGIAAFARDLGDRMADVVVVTMSEFGRAVQRERQPRHRSRPRQRDADPGRQRQGRQGLRQVARPRARSSCARDETWPSRRTSATSSPNASPSTLGRGTSRRYSRDSTTRRSWASFGRDQSTRRHGATKARRGLLGFGAACEPAPKKALRASVSPCLRVSLFANVRWWTFASFPLPSSSSIARGCEPTLRPCRRSPRRRAWRCGRTRRRTRARSSRDGRSRPAQSASAARSWVRPKSSPTPASPTSGCPTP